MPRHSDHQAHVVLRLNVCMYGQMDTFTGVRMWIILQATSGGIHMVQQTVGSETGGYVGRKYLHKAFLYLLLTRLLCM